MVYNPVNAGDALSSSVDDINAAFDNLARWFSGPTAPASPEPLMRWFNTTDSILYVRNTGNTAWIPCKLMDSETGMIVSDGTDKITICAPSGLSTDYVIKLPTAQGGSQTFLRNDGSGNLSWVAGGASGVTELDGLSDVTITGDTRGDLLVRGVTNWERLPVGTNGQVLTTDGTSLSWGAGGGGGGASALDDLSDVTISSPAQGHYLRRGASEWGNVAGLDIGDLTVSGQTSGDLILRGSTSWSRLARGSSGQVLTMNGTAVQWSAPSSGSLSSLSDTAIVSAATGEYLRFASGVWSDSALLATDLTISGQSQGDLLVRGASAWERLPVGTNGQFLTTNGTSLSWGAGGGGGASSLNDLSDVAVSSPAQGQYLRRGASEWGNVSGIDIDDLTVASEARGDVIVRGASGWVRLALGSTGQSLQSNGTDVAWATQSLASLSDTVIVSAAAGEYLRHNGSAWVDSVLLLSDLFESGQTTGDLAYYDGTDWSRIARGSDGQVLTATATSIEWAAGGGGGVSDLNDLGDVTISTPNTGEYLRYNGTAWVDSALLASDIFDVTNATGDILVRGASGYARLAIGTNGHVLTSNGTTATWAAAASGSTTLDGLTDTDIRTIATGDYLRWDGTNWSNVVGLSVADLTVSGQSQGDLIVRGASSWARLGLGTNGQVLKSNGTTVVWGSGSETTNLDSLTDVVITSGASGDYLRHNGTDWVDSAGVDLADLTVASEARGDIVTRGASDWGRLPLGASGSVLESDGTDAAWVASTGTGSIVRAATPTFSGTVTVNHLVATGSFTVQSVVLDAIIGSNTVSLLVGSTAASYNVTFANSTQLPTSGTRYVKIDSSGNLSYSAT